MARWRTVGIVILSLAVGWFANDFFFPPGKRSRPLLNFIKNNWWWAVPLILDEPKPEDASATEAGPDGWPLVHHERAL